MKNKVFEKYRGIHNRERVFLIANGPSLAETDLNLLKGEHTIAMNRISMIYAKNQEWRPQYYLFSSTNCRHPVWGTEWSNSIREAVREEKTTAFIAEMFKPWIDKKDKFGINWFSSMSENKPDLQGNILESCFSTDIIERIDKTGTTMNLAYQLAYHMGFTEIILVGADLGWTKDKGSENDPNHFDSSYRADMPRPEKVNHQMRNIHSLALRNFKKKNPKTKIFNASKRTVLDVLPIINYEKYILDGRIEYDVPRMIEARGFWSRRPQFEGIENG